MLVTLKKNAPRVAFYFGTEVVHTTTTTIAKSVSPKQIGVGYS
jgi:hypothetical protein